MHAKVSTGGQLPKILIKLKLNVNYYYLLQS